MEEDSDDDEIDDEDEKKEKAESASLEIIESNQPTDEGKITIECQLDVANQVTMVHILLL